MATEIERKFLVKNQSWQDSVLSYSQLKQAYICNQPNATVRVRIASGKAILNIKSKTEGISRAEFEYEIPIDEAEELLQLVALKPYIEKTRYKVKVGNHVWDLDVFDGDNKGLIMAEVELADENQAFEMPGWAGEEVSGDPKYYNANLVKQPYSQW